MQLDEIFNPNGNRSTIDGTVYCSTTYYSDPTLAYFPLSTFVNPLATWLSAPSAFWASYGIQNISTCVPIFRTGAPSAQIPVRQLTVTSTIQSSTRTILPPPTSFPNTVAPLTATLPAISDQTITASPSVPTAVTVQTLQTSDTPTSEQHSDTDAYDPNTISATAISTVVNTAPIEYSMSATDPAAPIIVASQTILPGSSVIAVSGTAYSEALSAAPASATGAAITTPFPAITANSYSAFVISSETLFPGGPAITVSGTPISLNPAASVAVIGTSTISLNPAIPALLTLPSDVVATQISSSAYVIGTQTLLPGGPAITLSGVPVSLASAATAIIIGSSGIPLNPTVASVITLQGVATATQDSSSDFVLGSQTLAPGGPAITVDGTPISLPPAGTAIIIGSSTFAVQPAGPAILTLPGGVVVTEESLPPTVTLSSGIVGTQVSFSDYVFGSQTLVPGGPVITVDGLPLSLAPGGTEVVVGSVTEVLTTTVGIGGVIMSGFAGGPHGGAETTTTGSFGGTPFTGNAGRTMRIPEELGIGVLIAIGTCLAYIL